MKKPPRREDSPEKLWAGRFSQAVDPLVESFTASIPYDIRLLPYDIAGSLAHVKMLARQGILSKKNSRLIQKGLQEILEEWSRGGLTFTLADEDVHMFVEKQLTAGIGPVGGQLHTGRSRNDQVALDLRLFMRDQINTLRLDLKTLQQNILAAARKHEGWCCRATPIFNGRNRYCWPITCWPTWRCSAGTRKGWVKSRTG